MTYSGIRLPTQTEPIVHTTGYMRIRPTHKGIRLKSAPTTLSTLQAMIPAEGLTPGYGGRPRKEPAVQTAKPSPLTEDQNADLAASLRKRLEARADPDGPAQVIEPPPLRRLAPETEALLDAAASARLALLFEPR